MRVRRVVLAEECDVLRVGDLVREVRAEVRRKIGARRKAEVSALIDEPLAQRCPPGTAVDGYHTGIGWRRTMRCPCGRQMLVAFRLPGTERFICRRCARVRYISDHRLPMRAFAGLGTRLVRLEGFRHRRGRRPRWFHRELAALRPILETAARVMRTRSERGARGALRVLARDPPSTRG